MRYLLMAFILLCVSCSNCCVEYGKVENSIWIYSTHLHQRKQTHHSNWGMPNVSGEDIINSHCERRIHHYRDCNCKKHKVGEFEHTDCDRCSVYKDWCEVNYYIWPIIQTKDVTGTVEQRPYFVEIIPGEYQRISKSARYHVNFYIYDQKNPENKYHAYNPGSLKELKKFNVGDVWKISTTLGNFEPIDLASAEKRKE